MNNYANIPNLTGKTAIEATGAPIALPIDTTHFQQSDIDALWLKTQELLAA